MACTPCLPYSTIIPYLSPFFTKRTNKKGHADKRHAPFLSLKSIKSDVNTIIGKWRVSAELAVQETLKRGCFLNRHGETYS